MTLCALYSTYTTATVTPAVHYYVDAELCHFDITYPVFNTMKFHQQIVPFNSQSSLMLFTSSGGCVNRSLSSAQTQQSTDVSDT